MPPRQSRDRAADPGAFEQKTLARGGNRAASASKEQTEEIRNYLLSAAEACFERYGVAKTTMDDVAILANVSRPTLYRYFKNRDGLVLAVLLRALRNFNERAEKLIARQPTFGHAVTEALALAIKVGISDPYVRMVLGPESYSVSSMLVGGSKAFHELAAELWEPLLRRGIESGEARSNLNVPTACRWLVDVEFVLATRVLEGSIEEKAISKLVRDYVLPGLVAPPVAATADATAKRDRSRPTPSVR